MLTCTHLQIQHRRQRLNRVQLHEMPQPARREVGQVERFPLRLALHHVERIGRYARLRRKELVQAMVGELALQCASREKGV